MDIVEIRLKCTAVRHVFNRGFTIQCFLYQCRQRVDIYFQVAAKVENFTYRLWQLGDIDHCFDHVSHVGEAAALSPIAKHGYCLTERCL